MTKPKDDKTFEEVRKKLGEAVKALPSTDIENLIKIANVVVKMKAVDLKMAMGEMGSEFEDD